MPTPPGTSDRARPEDLPDPASRKSSKWGVVLGSIAAVAALGTLLYIETSGSKSGDFLNEK